MAVYNVFELWGLLFVHFDSLAPPNRERCRMSRRARELNFSDSRCGTQEKADTEFAAVVAAGAGVTIIGGILAGIWLDRLSDSVWFFCLFVHL